MAKIQKLTIASAAEEVKQQGVSFIALGNEKWHTLQENLAGLVLFYLPLLQNYPFSYHSP
jgi:hypothetical protein